ncbi:MAG: hypothetical protein U0992_13765 [Planctomycetaceae bacterium]
MAGSPRPEWYFRWLLELRQHFTGEWEFIATMIVPAAILAFFLLVPLLDRRLPRRAGTVFHAASWCSAWQGGGWLTWKSFQRDWADPEYAASLARSREIAVRAHDWPMRIRWVSAVRDCC